MKPLEGKPTVADLFLDPTKFTKGVLARDVNGREVRPDNPSATCFCLSGATIYCYGGGAAIHAYAKLEDALCARGTGRMVFYFNDDPTTTAEAARILALEAGV